MRLQQFPQVAVWWSVVVSWRLLKWKPCDVSVQLWTASFPGFSHKPQLTCCFGTVLSSHAIQLSMWPSDLCMQSWCLVCLVCLLFCHDSTWNSITRRRTPFRCLSNWQVKEMYRRCIGGISWMLEVLLWALLTEVSVVLDAGAQRWQ